MGYRLLADLVVAVHFAYVTFVVVGQLLILVGLALHWRWVRNWWFRVAHLLAIAIVAGEAVLDIACPLTLWEQRLRDLGGTPTRGGTFVGNLLHDLIFVEAPPWAFTAGYVAFALVVAATFVLAPPRRRARGAA
jgi:Protein of Unknown function (DUF2784)